jgi:hypothetical protein
MRRTTLVSLGAVAVVLGALAHAGCGHTRTPYTVVSPPRDWSTFPAIVSIDRGPVIYALSDVHGGYDRAVALLVAHHVIDAAPPAPGAVKWTGGGAVVVVTGDLFDKGPKGLEALMLFQALETEAAAQGGRVVLTFGNHEAEFLDDPSNDKAEGSDGIDVELRSSSIDPLALANGSDPRGVWLRNRPFGARVGRWFFAHAGNTKGRSMPELEATLRAAVAAHDYDDNEIIGSDSILEARGWYSDPSTAPRYAAALGVTHIVFGHQPSALGPSGEIATGAGGVLFRIDCGMSPDVNDSDGRMLRVRTEGDVDVAESLQPDGSVREIWRGSAAAP